MKKEYPNTVMLKKGIVSIVIVAVVLILLLILHNMYKSSEPPKKSESQSNSTIRATANPSDTEWYKNKTVQKPMAEVFKVNISPNKKVSVSLQKNNEESADTVQQSQDVLKAMAASITTNQLTDENRGSSSAPIVSNPTGQGSSSSFSDQNMQSEKKKFLKSANTNESDYLGSILKSPISPYELKAGTTIPGMLITGINSDLPGQITGQVRSNVYDSISGKHLLVPQGSRLTGLYDSQITYGQERVLIVWMRIIFPNGQSINLQGMPGVDMSGYAGFNDQVDNHYSKIFGSVILMSALSAGAQLSQPNSSNNSLEAPTIGQTMAQSLGTNLMKTGTMLTAKNINIQPTLVIRQGYEFNISVTKDLVFPGPYKG